MKKKYLLFFAAAVCAAVFHNLENPDELWNYTFASNIANGLFPYRDFNMLQTPFSALVNGLAIALFGHHLIVIRMTGALLFVGIAGQLEKLSRRLGADGVYTMLIPLVFLCMFFWNVFLEYSCLILLAELCGIGSDLRFLDQEGEPSAGRQFGLGLLLGCAVMSKQTFGLFIAVASWVSCLAVCRMKRLGIRQAGKQLFFRMAGTSVPCFLFLFWLLGTGTFSDFWDMAFRGISTFSSRYGYWKFMKENAAYFLLGVLLPLTLLLGAVTAVRFRKERRGRVCVVILCYALSGCINMVPMANAYHVMTCWIPVFLLLIPVLQGRVLGWKWVRVLTGIGCAGIAVWLILITPGYILYSYEPVKDIRGLEGTFATEEQQRQIREIDAFVQEKLEEGTEVYILDNFAALYFLPSNRYHKYLDMFLVGNLGTKTPEACLRETEENAVFLFPDGTRSNFQYPYAAVEAFKNELRAGETLGSFQVHGRK